MGTLAAGIKEIFATAKTTGSNVMLCGNDGTPDGHMTMANLASVLGVPIGRRLHSGDDLDDFNGFGVGVYEIGDPTGISNVPNVDFGWCVFVSLRPAITSSNQATQILYGRGGLIAYRQIDGIGTNHWQDWQYITTNMPSFYKDYNTVSALAEAMKLYIGENSAIRASYSESFTNMPATRGFHVRFDDGSPSGNGYELFFSHGTADLWFRNESGGGWKKLALASV